MFNCKCKMCGAVLEYNGDETIVSCEYCGTQQMLPGVELPDGFSDEAEAIRIKNHRDGIDNANKKIKKIYWLVFAALAVLPAIPGTLFSDVDFSMGEGFAGTVIGYLLMAGAYSFVVLLLNLPTLITSMVYIFAKPKTQKARKRLKRLNIVNKIFLFSGIGWSFTFALFGMEGSLDFLDFGLVYLLVGICKIGFLVISFKKSNYKY